MIQLALVGLAHIHTPAFIATIKKRDEVRVSHVWDHDPIRATKGAEQLGATNARDAETIFNDANVDGVVICSETNRHEQLVLGATAAKKSLFVEKPLGFAAKDANASARAIEKSGALFSTGYFQRGWPAHLFIRDQIAKGNFGQITRVRGSNCHSGALDGWFSTDWRWMADPSIAGCGAFGDLGTHALDLLVWWLGDVTAATALLDPGTATYPKCDETGEGLLRFKSGAIGTLAAGWDDVADPVTFLVSGTEAHAAIINGKVHIKSRRAGDCDGMQPLRDAELPAAIPAGFEGWLNAISGQSNHLLVSAREAAYRSAVMESLYKGAAAQAWIKPKSDLD